MTADTYSNTLGVLFMGTGNDNNIWGNNANTAVFQIFEDAIANVLTSSVTGGTLDLSGSPPPTAASQVRYAALIFTGALGSAQIVQVPNLSKFWWVKNATSGAYALTIKTPSGTAVAVPQNSGWQLVQCDGADGIVVSPFNTAQVRMPDGSISAPPYSNVNETNSGWRRFGTQDWRLTINGVDILQVTGTGAATPSVVNILTPTALQVNGGSVLSTGAVVAAADGTVAAPGFSFNSELSTGGYRISAGNFGFGILGVNVATLTSIGFTWKNSTFAGSDLSPAAISASQNNYNPPGLGNILTLGAITAGTLYTPGTYRNVALTGGTGTGAKADIVVGVGGGVTSVTPTNRGINYLVADSLSCLAADIGGTGSGFHVPVGTVDALTGTCLRLNVTALASLTGMAGGAAGREIQIINIGTKTLQIPANSASSTAANRFATTINIVPGQSATWRYDATSSLWKLKNNLVAVAAAAIAAVSPDLLVINHVGTENTKRDIACGEATLIDANGNAVKFEAVAVTIDYTTTGANGCDVGTRAASKTYFEWLISDGVTIASLASLLPTLAGITLPTGYIYAKKVSASITDASSNLLRIRQLGQSATYRVTTATNTASIPLLQSGTAGSTWDVTTPTYVSVSLTNFVPSTARSVEIMLLNFYLAVGGAVSIAPNTSYSGTRSSNPPPLAIRDGQNFGDLCVRGTIVIEAMSLGYAGQNAGSAAFVTGWDDTN